jgi:predicted amidohydrolase
MTAPFTLACCQFTAARDFAPNIEAARRQARRARAAGADLIAFPENLAMMEPDRAAALAKAVPEAEHPVLAAMQDLARETGAWILAGSINAKRPGGRVANRSLLLDPAGAIVARYDKIHLFDVDLPTGERYRESERVEPGAAATIADTPWGRLGMTVCYDVRFPLLYRALAQAGAIMIGVPAAFTAPTGRAHWHTLLRARAIENGAYVFAPAQWGAHADGRRTFGHSLIVDPWGEVLADGGEGETVITARIDPARVAAVRASLPSLQHDRPFAPPAAAGTRQAAE